MHNIIVSDRFNVGIVSHFACCISNLCLGINLVTLNKIVITARGWSAYRDHGAASFGATLTNQGA